MTYMLDTNICIYAIKNKPEQVFQRVRLNWNMAYQKAVIRKKTGLPLPNFWLLWIFCPLIRQRQWNMGRYAHICKEKGCRLALWIC